MTTNFPTEWAIDTNVLIYFLDQDSPYHQSAVQVFKQSEEHQIHLTVAQQNILELIQGLTKWYDLSLPKAVTQTRRLLEFDLQVVHPLPQTVDAYLNFCDQHSGTSKKHFDFYLAATLLDNGVTSLVTEDPKGFQLIKELKIYKLAEF